MEAIKYHICLLIVLFSAVPWTAQSWTRPLVTDESAVADAELIVVATIIPESIRKIEHKRDTNGNGGASWHHRAKLQIVEMLKGRSTTNIIEIIIHYGLDPVTGRTLSTKYVRDPDRGYVPSGDPSVIGIWDNGGLGIPITEDIRQPHIWLLTRKDFGYTTPDENEVVGIREPKHIQPITKKNDIRKLITK